MNCSSKIQFFSSFEDMNEGDAKVMALKTPFEHFRDTLILIKSFYAEELEKEMDKTIRVKNGKE